MGQFIFTLTNGLVIGAIYALSACGVSLIAGLMRVINFAHGEFFILGGYFSYYLSLKLGMSPILAMVAATFSLFLIGLFVERVLIRNTYGDSMASLIVTFILSIVLQNAILLLFGPFPNKPPDFVSGSIHLIGDFDFGVQRLVSGGVSLLLFFCLFFFIKKTWFGKCVRAVAQDRQMAALLGINPERVNWISFGIGVAMAGAAGVILAPSFTVTPMAGAPISLVAFIVVVLGGVGSIRGCLAGGLLLGVVENFGSAYLSSMYSQLFGFLSLILVLLFKPSGLYGAKI